jgi:hypothetical protein
LLPTAIGLELIEPENDQHQWISTDALLESLIAQGIKTSKRTLQEWAQKHQGTKPGFEPPYLAKKDKGKLVWMPKTNLINEGNHHGDN